MQQNQNKEQKQLATDSLSEKQIIAQNISFFRKKLNISQKELAAKLQYSNKNISKWERGETTPDIFTLKKLANIFSTTIDTLVNPITEENKNAITTKTIIPFRWKVYMLALIDSIIFLTACVSFFILSAMNPKFPSVIVFLFTVPLIILTVFIFICWTKHKVDTISLSLLGWSITLCLHMIFINYHKILYIYIIALGYQILVPFFAKLVNSGKIIKLNKILIFNKKNKSKDN